MTELIRQAFERFGADVCVEHAGQSVCTRAFVQPLTAESNREPFSVAPRRARIRGRRGRLLLGGAAY